MQYSEEAYDANRHKHENFDVQHQQWYPPGPSSSSTSSVTCSTTPVLDTDEEGSGGTLGTGGAPRVVIFTAAYYVCDGVSLTIRKLRAHLQSRGIASRVVSCGPAGWSETDVFTVPSIPLPIINADDNFGYSLGIRLTPECKAQIKAFNPSVIHFTVPDFLALDALRWAKAERIPVMGTWHSNYADYLQFYHLSVIRLPVERFIRSFYVNMPIYVPTPFVRKRLVDSGFPENRVSLWGRGVDLKMFNPNFRSMAFRRGRGIADDEVVILWVGRLVKEKSPDIWAEVIRRLDQEGLKFRALVVGSGSYEEHMKQLPRTEHLGWMSGAALAEVYASVDLFLFPSEVETFGNVTLEALASGVPCIASAGCSGHLVHHGVNGFAISRADVDEYHSLTRELVVNGPLRARFAEKARGSIVSLEHDRVMDMMVANYEGVVQAYHRPGGEGCNSRRGGWGDVYIMLVYHFFSFLMMLGTPLMKAYVAIARILCGIISCSGADWFARKMRSAAHLVCSAGWERRGLPLSHGPMLGREGNGMTSRERMNILVVCVWLSVLVVLYHTYMAAGWTTTMLGEHGNASTEGSR